MHRRKGLTGLLESVFYHGCRGRNSLEVRHDVGQNTKLACPMCFASQGHCSDERWRMGRSSKRVSAVETVPDSGLDADTGGLVSSQSKS